LDKTQAKCKGVYNLFAKGHLLIRKISDDARLCREFKDDRD